MITAAARIVRRCAVVADGSIRRQRKRAGTERDRVLVSGDQPGKVAMAKLKAFGLCFQLTLTPLLLDLLVVLVLLLLERATYLLKVSTTWKILRQLSKLRLGPRIIMGLHGGSNRSHLGLEHLLFNGIRLRIAHGFRLARPE